MKTMPGCLKGCFFYLCLPLMVVGLGFFVGIPTYQEIAEWKLVQSLLTTAHSLTIIHYNPYAGHIAGHEIIYGTKQLNSEEFPKVAAAFSICPDAGIPGSQLMCTFDPHHKIVVVDSTGHQTVIRVCFECDHVQIGENGKIFATPFVWRWRLHKFFEEEGLPYQPDRYIRDYQKATDDTSK